ncbi:acid protease [Fistulina hepatica ATCC 64428]|uniref:Acid protease n=1 Tax=Fistulina hepatica ATCC 64428 TaxID=1128425 RepID=A0A0D7AF50_9AGAR|nr:acid protease [Fistulina hepatica ATCC 64428]
MVTCLVRAGFHYLPTHPVPHGHDEITVPLHRRASLVSENGVFNLERATALTIATQNKHRQNLVNLRKNAGEDALPPGAVINAVAILPSRIANNLLEKRQSVSLTDEDDVEWLGTASVGTPLQSFMIDYDTGSSDFWVPSSLCKTTVCMSKRRFDTSLSSTSERQYGVFEIGYGDGSMVVGQIWSDVVNVAGIKAIGQYFSPVTTLSDDFNGDPLDGIMGLAFPSLSEMNASPFLQTARTQGTCHTGTFAFYLSTNGSELHLCGTNHRLYRGGIEYHNVTYMVDSHGRKFPGFWQIGSASASLNGVRVNGTFETIIDSGTTIMYGPPDAVAALYAQVHGSKLFEKDQGLYSFPCNAVPRLVFSWGGKDWHVSKENMNLGTTEDGSSDCVGALAGRDMGLGTNVWLLGDSFMKNVYSVFDFDKEAVGFAQLADSAPS